MEEIKVVWRSRHSRDVSADLMRYAPEDDQAGYFAALRLGQLEHAEAEGLIAALRLRAEEDNDRISHNRPLQLAWALGRIRSRGLWGEAKLEVVAHHVGRTIDELLPNRWMILSCGPSEDEIIRGNTVQLLYAMVKQGDDIAPLLPRFSIGWVERHVLQWAALPLDEEITTMMDYLGAQSAATATDGPVGSYYLPNIGPRATDLLLQRFEAMSNAPDHFFEFVVPSDKYLDAIARDLQRTNSPFNREEWARPRLKAGYVNLFDAAYHMLPNPRVLAMLQRLQENLWDTPFSEVAKGAAQRREWWERYQRELHAPDPEAASFSC